MNFLSSMFTGGSGAAQNETAANAVISNALTLLGSEGEVLLSDGTKNVGGTATTVG